MAAKQKKADLPTEELALETPVTEVVSDPSTSTEIAEYSPLTKALAVVSGKYLNVVFDCSTTKGLDEAKAARVEVREVRYSIQNAEKTVLVPYQDKVKEAQAKVNEVKAYGLELKEKVLLIETPIDESIKAEEKRRTDEKAAADELERQRVEAIQNKITRFRSVAAAYASRSAEDIAAVLESVKVSVILPDDYAEFEAEGTIARDNAIEQLETLHKSAVEREAAAAQLAAQQKELEELRKKQQEADERARIEREERDAADRKRIAEQQAELDKQRKQLEEQQADQRRKDEQHRRDQEELQRLRAQAAAPAPTPAPTAAAHVHAQPVKATTTTSPVEEDDSAVDPGMPTADAIIEVVALAFDESLETAGNWLRAIKF